MPVNLLAAAALSKIEDLFTTAFLSGVESMSTTVRLLESIDVLVASWLWTKGVSRRSVVVHLCY